MSSRCNSLANALSARVRARRRDLRLHPAIAGRHAVSMTRDGAGGEVFSVATCQCAWRSRVVSAEIADQDLAIEQHFRDVIGRGDLAA